jgi:hypothetical protein
MKLRRLATGIGTALGTAALCVFLFGAVATIVDQARITYATPEMQSPFLRTYTLTPVLDRFRCIKYPSGTGDGSGAGAGYGFTTHEREFYDFFVMQSSERDTLMKALIESVSFQLNSTGARITAQTGSPEEGMQFRYIAGPTIGTVTIKPPSLQAQVRIPFLRPDEMPVSVDIRIDEKWTKPEA